MRMLCSPRLVGKLMLISLTAGIVFGVWLAGTFA